MSGTNTLFRPDTLVPPPQNTLARSAEQAPMISDETMAELLKRLLIAATGGYNDQPIPLHSTPAPSPLNHELPGPIPNMTVDDFRQGYMRQPETFWWITPKTEADT